MENNIEFVDECDIPVYDTDDDYVDKTSCYLVTKFGEWIKPDEYSINQWLHENYTNDCLTGHYMEIFNKHLSAAVEFYKQDFDETIMAYVKPEHIIDGL